MFPIIYTKLTKNILLNYTTKVFKIYKTIKYTYSNQSDIKKSTTNIYIITKCTTYRT